MSSDADLLRSKAMMGNKNAAKPNKPVQTRFKLLPLNDREAQYYPPGSMELKRQQGGATPQIWVVSPEDIKNLAKLMVGQLCKDD